MYILPFFSVFRSLALMTFVFLAKTQLGQNAIRPYIFDSNIYIYVYVKCIFGLESIQAKNTFDRFQAKNTFSPHDTLRPWPKNGKVIGLSLQIRKSTHTHHHYFRHLP